MANAFDARRLAALTLASSLLLASSIASYAQETYSRWAGGATPIRGYDTTAYFSAGRPMAGARAHTVAWKGGTFRFATAIDAQKFRANPAAFQPQFGGYCTGGLSQNHVVHANPKFWRIHNGRLYMFATSAGARRFANDPENVISAARAYAKKVGVTEK